MLCSGPHSHMQLRLTHERSVIIEAKRCIREREIKLNDLIRENIPECLQDVLETDAIIMANAREASRKGTKS